MDRKYTIKEIARELKVSKRTVLREIDRGNLQPEKMGRKYLIPEKTLLAYLRRPSDLGNTDALAFFLSKKSEMVSLLQRLVSLKNSDKKLSEAALAKVIKKFLDRHGFRSVIYTEKETTSLRGSFGFADEGILLNCPLDTVIAGDVSKWTYPPYEGVIKAGRMYGRGTADCKGGIVAMLYTLLALKAYVPEDKVRVEFVFDGGEQDGQYVGLKTILKNGLPVKAGIIGYAGQMDELIIGARGYHRYEFVAHGQAVHTGSRSKTGVNAISTIAELISKVESLALPQSSNPYFAFGSRLTFSLISGGNAINIVPDMCTVSLDVRTVPEMDKQVIDSSIDGIVSGLESETRGRFIAWRYLCGQEAYIVSGKEKIVQSMSAVIDQTFKNKLPLAVSGPANIGNLLYEYGVPMVVFGPKGNNVHSYDEYVEIDSLPLTAGIYFKTILNYFTS